MLQGDVAFRVRIVEHVHREHGTVGHQGPALFGIEVGFAGRVKRRPRHGAGIQVSHLHVELAPNQKMGVGQNEGGRITDVSPSGRRSQGRPCIGDRIVNRAQVGQGELTEVIFAAFDEYAAISQNGGSESLGGVARLEAGSLRPGTVNVAAGVVGCQNPPVGVIEALR